LSRCLYRCRRGGGVQDEMSVQQRWCRGAGWFSRGAEIRGAQVLVRC
jgi:hypothetical protein